jgi:hypothetical protein
MDNYTPHEIEELKKCSHPYTGQQYFLENYFKIQHPRDGAVLMELNRYQEHALDRWIANRFCIDMVSRQMGKTSLHSGYALWCMLFNNDFRILHGANKIETSMEMIFIIRYAFEHLPDFLKLGIRTNNKREMLFDNGSGIMCSEVNHNLGQGMTVNLLIVEEAGFANSSSLEEAMMGLLPAICTTGGVIMTSSKPHDDDHFFNTIWCDSRTNNGSFDAGLYPYTFNKNKNQDEEWKTMQILSIGRNRFNKEYLCR